MKNIKIHLLAFPAFFILFYIESISVGGIKIAVLWKLILIGYILLYFLNNPSKPKIKKFIFFGYLYSIKNFLTLSSMSYFMGSLVEAIKTSFIPYLTHFLINISNSQKINLYKLLLILSVYIILSSIPFLLGILEPLTQGYDLSLFGVEAFGFVGIFQVAHGAAVTVAFALVVLMYAIQKENNKQIKIFYFLLIILGLWVEIQTFARTGFAIVIVSGFYLFLMRKKFTFYLKFIPFFIILSGAFYIYYLNSEVLQMRMAGTNKYLIASHTEVEGGSGRLKFMNAAILNWSNSGELGILIGLGIEEAKDLMKVAVGMRIYAHNGFIDILQFNGLLGILLYMLFIYYLYKYIHKYKTSEDIQLVNALFLAYLTAMLLQGEHFFLADLLFAMSLANLHKGGSIDR